MATKTLSQAVAAHPFPAFASWWPMGPKFIGFMARAIVSQWRELTGDGGELKQVQNDSADYLQVVYRQEARSGLVEDFATRPEGGSNWSGEFDGLSYAFYKSAFEVLGRRHPDPAVVGRERRAFTRRVGAKFFDSLQAHLDLELPDRLENRQQFDRLKTCIAQIGAFLVEEGYVRDHFDFRFALVGKEIATGGRQTEEMFLEKMKRGETGFAVYEMGFPVILPSAVYLYQTIGEAQHHSSRTIEALFYGIGCRASEREDFDPGDHPPERVIELWEIRKEAGS